MKSRCALVQTDSAWRDRTVRFAGDWVEQTLTFDMQHVALVPGEMVNGTVFIQIGSDASPSDYVASELIGAREFLPNFTSVLGQTPLIGGLLPSVPRPGSAIMLASFMSLALYVSEGVAALAKDRLRIEEHYLANRDGWLDIMKQYTYHHADNCWQQYFGMTIAFHPAYNPIRLEPDSPFKTSLQQDMVATRMWPTVAGHHNAYFDFIAASQGSAGLVPPATLQETAAQLAGFVPPPKARVLVDNSSYGIDAGCNQTATVVDVHDRVPRDFIFQHRPFELTTAPSKLRQR